MEMLRTPDERFYGLPGYPYDPHYVEINGGRFHYLDEGQGEVILCLHGHPTWSYSYRKLIPLLKKNYRVIAPDLFGFGRSDKFTRQKDYSFYMHYRTLIRFIEKTELKDITLVVQDWGGLLGLSVLGKYPELFKRVVFMNTSVPIGEERVSLKFRLWRLFARLYPNFPVRNVIKWGTYRTPQLQALGGYEAPFPDEKYKAALRITPSLVPTGSSDDGVRQLKRARKVLSAWDKPAIVMFSDSDHVNRGADKWFRENVPTVKNEPEIIIERAGHFLTEDRGKEIADHIHDFIVRSNARERGGTVELPLATKKSKDRERY
ncbi:MAG: alpha/beta fold hydrolase [Flavobacteriales bacterium]|nr:alpha/beta fold hydrolase [Flavobacteriales bacterium]